MLIVLEKYNIACTFGRRNMKMFVEKKMTPPEMLVKTNI